VKEVERGKEMKILFVQDHLQSGGAARAAGRWGTLLNKAGHDVKQAAGDEPSAAGLLLTGKPPRGWPRILEWFGEAAVGRRTTVRKKFDEVLSQEKPGLVWFHNLAGGAKWGWSEEMVTMARGHAPVLWTLHDMWALGDSSESYWEEDSVVEGGRGQGAERSGPKVQKCEGEKVGSGEESRVSRVCGENGKYPVTLTAPSRWLAGLTKKKTGQDCVFLPNPIDLENFSPGDQKAARRKLGLPEEGLVVLAGADSLADPRKGFDLLREAWGRLPSNRATLALFGRHGENRPGEHYLGNLSSDEEMVAAYLAADLYVHPARMENAPCTIQESLACGTPVVAFAVGGIPEMVEQGKTGFLAGKPDSRTFGEALALALAERDRLSRMRLECRSTAEEIWRPEALAENFREVVERLKG
jgi:glycosyltransferase involved in cell wall biosynthesis